MGRQIVTIAPPTPNGDLHLGHISGPYLAADVYTRTQRLLGQHTVLLCYSDDYQSYLARKARELGVEPFALAHNNGRKISETLKMIGIDVDWFHQAGHNDYFRRSAALFYHAAHEGGALYGKQEAIPYFPTFDVWGYEAYGRGSCDHCGAPSDASQCEDCAYLPTLANMQDIQCTLGASEVEWRPVNREFLRLGNFRGHLRDLYRDKPLRPYLREYIEQILSLPELDWGITRPHEHGIELEEPNRPNLHTWFCGVAGYHAAFSELAASRGEPALVNTYWRGKDTSIAFFFGFDCSFSHTIVYPVLLSLVNGYCRDVTPYSSRFLKLEGEDFSTSRGRAIWVRDILQSYPSDAVRYYLALNSPEEEVCNFVMADFRDWHERVFHGRLQPLLDRAAQVSGNGFDVPDPIAARLTETLADWQGHANPNHFSMRRLAATCQTMLDWLDVQNGQDQRTQGTVLAAYATLASPIHPNLSAQLFDRLGIDAKAMSAWLGRVLGLGLLASAAP